MSWPLHGRKLETPSNIMSSSSSPPSIPTYAPPPPNNTSTLSTATDLFDQLDPQVSGHVKEVGWSILERFARVTQVSRDTASRFLNHPLTQPLLPILPQNVQRLSSRYRPEEHQGPVLDEILKEFPAASMYFSQWLQTRVLGQQNPQHGSSTNDMDQDMVWEEDEDEQSTMGTFGVLSIKSSLPKPNTKRSPLLTLTAEDWVTYTCTGFKNRITRLRSETVSQPTDRLPESFPVLDNQLSEICTDTELPEITLCPVSISDTPEISLIPDSTDQLPASTPIPPCDNNTSDVIHEIKTRIFLGGIEHDIRPHVWKFLLGYLPWGSTSSEQEAIIMDKTNQYNQLKSQWVAYTSESMSEEQWETWSDWRHRIAKDVIRTDRHHPFYASSFLSEHEQGSSSPTPSNADEEEMLMCVPVATETMCTGIKMNVNLLHLANVLATYVCYLEEIGRNDFGYVQGMSDLCAVLLLLQSGSEVDTFWCFVGLMERLHLNFHENQIAMHHQLTTLKSLTQFLDFRLFRHFAQCDALNMFFAFRWLLIWFKREFSISDVIKVWEVCLTDVKSCEYVLFIAMAMIEHLRSDLLLKCTRFDQILKLVNESAEHLPVDKVLEHAEILFQVFESKLGKCHRAVLGDKVAGAFPISQGSVSDLDKVLVSQLRHLSVTKHLDFYISN